LTEFYRDQWAKTTSPNPNVKIYIGAPASPQAADSGYVDGDSLAKIIKTTQSLYPSFGGAMLWDADSAHSESFSLSLIAWSLSVKTTINLMCRLRKLLGKGEEVQQPSKQPCLLPDQWFRHQFLVHRSQKQ